MDKIKWKTVLIALSLVLSGAFIGINGDVPSGLRMVQDGITTLVGI